ncbi:pinin [Lutzomyia longipalpis]|uniref:pinin n=1 Tax=Lutzomyia longipalpis TaxID=7200 RepID=UPI002483C89D|nr:pinin [Lutzomyia longipalpis]
MGTVIVDTYDDLQEKLNEARSRLKGLNDNIRRVIGRDVVQFPPRVDRKRPYESEFGAKDNVVVKRRFNNDTKSVFSRLSGPPHRDDDVEAKPKVFSRVIKELPTREEIVAAQGLDEQSKARNKRMFAVSLLGTLQKFCQEESRLKPKEEKKAQIEKRLEDQARREKINMEKERKSLFNDRKQQQLQIRLLEQKMSKMQEQKDWEVSQKPLVHFIKTKTKPHLFYKPKIVCKKTEKKLAESRAEIEKTIETKRNSVREEIADMEKRYRAEAYQQADDLPQRGQESSGRDVDSDGEPHSSNGHTDEEMDGQHRSARMRGRLGPAKNDDGGPLKTLFKKEDSKDNVKMIISVVNDQAITN